MGSIQELFMKKTPVTRSFLPPFKEYTEQVKRAFDNGWLTNRGELVLELEDKLRTFLDLSETSILCMNNGTIPLQIALKLLGNGGEIITTPFSYVATTSAIVWENCKPVFVDIHPEYLTIDETKIEAAITPKTTAILATHVFGNPCHVKAISAIALKYGLKVIYDGAHAFGVTYHGKSLLTYGDVSTCSFHATKVFQTGEGGAIFCTDKELASQLFYSHDFGHDGPLAFKGLGINAKMNELQAAMGLAILPHFPTINLQRRKISEAYDHYLSESPGLQTLRLRPNTSWNYSHYPVLFNSEQELLQTLEALQAEEVFPRRYFYPSLNTLPYVPYTEMPIAESTASRIACLPIYPGLEISTVERIATAILAIVNR